MKQPTIQNISRFKLIEALQSIYGFKADAFDNRTTDQLKRGLTDRQRARVEFQVRVKVQ